MLHWAIRILESAGYSGIVFLMVLENVFPPIPSEVILPLAGFTVTQGQLTLFGVICAGTIGSLLGALPLYYLGKYLGAGRLECLADRHGTWLAVSGQDIKHAMKCFHRHGAISVMIGRVIPGVRSLISIPAGVCGMALSHFLLYSALGTALWTTLLVYIGSLLGENYQAVATYVQPLSFVVFAVLIWTFLLRRLWH